MTVAKKTASRREFAAAVESGDMATYAAELRRRADEQFRSTPAYRRAAAKAEQEGGDTKIN